MCPPTMQSVEIVCVSGHIVSVWMLPLDARFPMYLQYDCYHVMLGPHALYWPGEDVFLRSFQEGR